MKERAEKKQTLNLRKQGNRKIYLRGWRKYKGFEERPNGYFSLDDLLDIQKEGREFTVADADGNDITSDILADVLKMVIVKNGVPTESVKEMLSSVIK